MQIKNSLLQQFSHQATQQQVEVFEILGEFLHTFAVESCFILKGYAGTGKTSIISALVKSLPRFHKRSVLLAPTGRAAKVMSAYSGRNALTIHKKIYRKKNAISLDMQFSLADNTHENTLFIVDEASMISNEGHSMFSNGLLHDLIEYVQSGENCTLMLVGDIAQLPPVGLETSPALDPEYMNTEFGLEIFSYEMTDVVRQDKNSGILYNATKIRNEIRLDEEFAEYSYPQFVTKSFKDIFRMNGERLIEGLHYAYDKFGIQNTMVICRSNKSANLYNQHIRNQILFRDEEITGGDIVMVVKNNYYWLQDNDEKNTGFIANGDMAVIKKVSNVHEMHGFRFADLYLEFMDNNEGDAIRCRVLLDSLYVDSPNLPYEQQQKLYNSIAEDYQDIYAKKDRMEAIKKDPYYNALQIKFAYAITCHKAQGGQWPLVFIDQGYMNDDMLNTEFMRWLYTAITRATQELFLVNFNEKFYEA
ncbi:ATP-dependent DNA helicase [Sphingobacterium cellulitidis]|uniref:ATP-dependent endonuclease n=1 Tax=Sphingobacterium cellulitidis TaxID=1768011 RepID=A0A8H9G2N7_9SPHI|nr:AAA family ATPase [Sphingobacterium soli]MBA8986530.1 exodeoxyribonuclease-5 [Sphingobacterium soli]GGE20937.1 ATP-dependent endonuclease [Sphingobacterium soli]